jgi:hypothetical protein
MIWAHWAIVNSCWVITEYITLDRVDIVQGRGQVVPTLVIYHMIKDRQFLDFCQGHNYRYFVTIEAHNLLHFLMTSKVEWVNGASLSFLVAKQWGWNAVITIVTRQCSSKCFKEFSVWSYHFHEKTCRFRHKQWVPWNLPFKINNWFWLVLLNDF